MCCVNFLSKKKATRDVVKIYNAKKSIYTNGLSVCCCVIIKLVFTFHIVEMNRFFQFSLTFKPLSIIISNLNTKKWTFFYSGNVFGRPFCLLLMVDGLFANIAPVCSCFMQRHFCRVSFKCISTLQIHTYISLALEHDISVFFLHKNLLEWTRQFHYFEFRLRFLFS